MPQADDIIAFIEKLENPNVAIDQAKCLKVRNRNASCSRCMDACPAQCISCAQNKISFDAAACLGCLTCTTVCPTGALTGKRITDTAVFSAAQTAQGQTPGQVVFACESLLAAVEGLYNPLAVVKLKCISGVDTTMLVYLASTGVKDLLLVAGDCANCHLEHCLATAQGVVDSANTLLEAWGAPAQVRITNKLPGNTKKNEKLGYDASRRGFFTDVRVESRKVAMDASTLAFEKAFGKESEPSLISKLKVGGEGTLPLISMPRRKRLLAALDSFGEPADDLIETGLFGQVVIDLDKCRACRICATFCPSGSLFKFHTKSGKIGVKQMVRDCVSCHSCVDVCLHGALTLDPEVFARDIAESAVERYEMDAQPAESKFTFNH